MGLFDDDDHVSGEEIIGATAEIIGDMGAIGDELDDVLNSVISGNPPSGLSVSRVAQLSNKMRMLRNIDPNAVMTRNVSPNKRRYWHAPFPTTAFAAAALTGLQMNPQELFRAERLFVPSNLANDYNITNLQVGQKNQLLTPGEINCSVFSEVAVRSFLNLDTANIGNIIILSLRNDGALTTSPRPDLLGTAAVS